jgi:multidrug efflux system outer membrane protein
MRAKSGVARRWIPNARALVASTAANIPALEAALIRTRYRLAVLCGLQPTALDAELAPVQPLPGLEIGGIGRHWFAGGHARRGPTSSWPRRRPRQRRRKGVARSALFPQLTLGGTIGQNSLQFSDLGKGASYVYNLARN